MPTYEYACDSCEHRWELLQKISDDALDTCPSCAAKTAKRLISGGSFILKGGGWYADLYASSSNASSNSKSDKSDAGTGTGAAAPAGSAEGKPAPKTETKTETKAETPKAASPKSDS
jgi:putative FmdB family regulatory protein